MKRTQRTILLGLAIVPTLAVAGWLATRGPEDPEHYVVVYCALDRLYAQPILKRFADETGIWVRPKWDTEATKTVGLVEAIRAEHARVRCDVFWNNEVSQSIALADDGALQEYRSPSAAGLPKWARDPGGRWTGFAARARVLIYNRDRVERSEVPTTLEQLTEPRWKGRVGIAKPLFGTTATHVAQLWSRDAAGTEAWLDALKANGVVVCAGNADVKDRVVAGELDVGLTDTDDANLALLAGAKVGVVFPDQRPNQRGALLIPNSVAIVAGAPHLEDAKVLVDYLLSREVEEALARSRSAQIPMRKGIAGQVGWIPPNLHATAAHWQEAADALTDSQAYIERVFLTR
jgi:iron(III) transport system substrate-binding protein